MIFPLGDDNSDRRVLPAVNVAFIVANVLVFVGLQGLGNNNDFTMRFSTVPAEILTGRDVVTDDRTVVVNSMEGPQQIVLPGLRQTPIPVYLSILTSMFMHGGIAHLLGNMWFLWIFGDNIEQDLGRARYAAFYILCGILASLAHVLSNVSESDPSYPVWGHPEPFPA